MSGGLEDWSPSEGNSMMMIGDGLLVESVHELPVRFSEYSNGVMVPEVENHGGPTVHRRVDFGTAQ